MKILLWDFDGTLAYSESLWSNSLLGALNMISPNHSIKTEQLKICLSKGFPWHEPMNEHLKLCEQGAWWNYMEDYFSQIYQKLGYRKSISLELAQKAHGIVLDYNMYKVVPYAIEVLEELQNEGWTNYILSNHVPELPQIADKLGFTGVIKECFTSANIGYEKPHPGIYKYVFDRIDNIGNMQICIMIGDSYNSDILGAENAGIHSILVNAKRDDRAKYWCENLTEIKEIIYAIKEE